MACCWCRRSMDRFTSFLIYDFDSIRFASKKESFNWLYTSNSIAFLFIESYSIGIFCLLRFIYLNAITNNANDNNNNDWFQQAFYLVIILFVFICALFFLPLGKITLKFHDHLFLFYSWVFITVDVYFLHESSRLLQITFE